MDPRAFRVAQAFVRKHLRRAKYAPEFIQWVERQRFPSPKSDEQIKFVSLPVEEQTRIYKQWAAHRVAPAEAKQPQQRRPEEVERRNLEIARAGEVVASEVLSSGGDPQAPGYNQSFIVKLRHGDDEQMFIRKPAEGEEKHLRVGIPGGTYHMREEAAYGFDRALGGRGIVPVTVSRGSDDGSYQLWAQNARAMHGEDLDDLVSKVKPEDLHQSPDFHRLNLLDLVSGQEDRHAGNLLHWFDGEEKPENLRLVAIDNGLCAPDPSSFPDHRVYYHPFKSMYRDDESRTEEAREQMADDARQRGNEAVASSLSQIPPELHEQLKKLDLAEMAQTMTGAGLREEGAVRAALTRIAALQENPQVFKDFLTDAEGDLEEAWQQFQHSSGQDDDLLRRVGAEDRKKEIDKAVAAARPDDGWVAQAVLENMYRDLESEQKGYDSWGIFEVGDGVPDDATKRASFKTVWWLRTPGR